jgi:hypothetical protein
VTRFEKPINFEHAYPHTAPAAPTIKTLVLLAGLVAYAAGFVALYPLAANSVARNAAEGADPAPIQFVAP